APPLPIGDTPEKQPGEVALAAVARSGVDLLEPAPRVVEPSVLESDSPEAQARFQPAGTWLCGSGRIGDRAGLVRDSGGQREPGFHEPAARGVLAPSSALRRGEAFRHGAEDQQD